MIQVAVIESWHPSMSANVREHWSKQRKRHETDKLTSWAAARQCGWQPVYGKAKLTITLVYSRRYRMDTDNLYAKCKGVIDGLKSFIVDDDTEHLDLIVRAEVVHGVKETRLELESV